MFLSPIRLFTILAMSLIIESGSYGTSMISIFPDSILEKSRMSLMMVRRFLPEARIWWIKSRAVGDISSRRAISAIPSTAFIGVRISWLMFARKSDLSFALFSTSALFASMLKLFVATVLSTSARLFSDSAALSISFCAIIRTFLASCV